MRKYIDTAQLYFILGRAELHWNFSSAPKDGSDIQRFSDRKWVLTMCIAGNLWISETSRSKLEKIQCSSVLPSIKYNCTVLFLNPLYWLLICTSEFIFPQTTIVKPSQNFLISCKTKELTELSAGRIFPFTRKSFYRIFLSLFLKGHLHIEQKTEPGRQTRNLETRKPSEQTTDTNLHCRHCHIYTVYW